MVTNPLDRMDPNLRAALPPHATEALVDLDVATESMKGLTDQLQGELEDATRVADPTDLLEKLDPALRTVRTLILRRREGEQVPDAAEALEELVSAHRAANQLRQRNAGEAAGASISVTAVLERLDPALRATRKLTAQLAAPAAPDAESEGKAEAEAEQAEQAAMDAEAEKLREAMLTPRNLAARFHQALEDLARAGHRVNQARAEVDRAEQALEEALRNCQAEGEGLAPALAKITTDPEYLRKAEGVPGPGVGGE